MRETLALTRKELNSYFSSPMAVIFIGVFLAVVLGTFFWVEDFWARGIADIRPLFLWLPRLLIFLSAALTMRQWSEEQQSGTMEMLLIMPVRLWQLVLGKFLAVLALIAIALALTLILPITVGSLGDLDLGPVVGGYLAALLMAAAYVAIGLFISSLTNNQIVSLILAVLLAGLLFLVGSSLVTDQVGSSTGEVLRALGSGSRFESIERGVIDVRDLLYYGSLTAVFLVLNVLSLDMKRWGKGESTRVYRFNTGTSAGLIAANLLIANILLYPVTSLRTDLTEFNEYSLSDVTRETLSNLEEPLRITGYFSEKNHPLLQPLIPQIRDTLDEYRIAGKGNVELEFLDPIKNPELEQEANQTYGIRPTPLPVQSRTGTEIVNAYMDILIRYGDQSVTLNLLDLIEQQGTGSSVEIRLRNLEYDLTSTIRKVVSGFQSIDAVLESLSEPAHLTLYVTPNTLPEQLQDAPATIEKVANDLNASGNLIYTVVDQNIDPQALFDQYEIRPLALDFLGQQTFYLHMVLESGDAAPQVIFPTGDFSEATVRTNIEAALKRVATGFLTVVGVWTPPGTPQFNQFTGQQIPSFEQFTELVSYLREENEVRTVNLATGQVPSDVDVLLAIAPQNLTDIERYAIDQYLMRGGTIFLAAGNYTIGVDQFTGSTGLVATEGGLQEMLTAYGITIEPQMVMDTQNEPFPAVVTRNIGGGLQVQEYQAVNFPFFVDVRADGMARKNPILANLPAITLHWVSPITLDEDKNSDRKVERLLHSTRQSWLRTNTSIEPNPDLYPETGFAIEGERKSYTLAVTVQGSFESFFKDKPSPFENTEDVEAPVGFISQSPDSARLVIVGSSTFLNDNLFALSRDLSQDRYRNSLQFVQNIVDWSTEDTALLAIRSRGSTARLLEPVDDDEKRQWEIINYVVALVALVGLVALWWLRKRAEQPMPLEGFDTANLESATA